MSAIVLDASVAVKLVSDEPDSDAALRRVVVASEVIAPDWMMIEASHALWKKVQASSLDEGDAKAGIDALARIVETFSPASALMSVALELSFALPHPVYDCLYLALAKAKQTIVLTADRQFVRAARQAGFGGAVEYLEAR